MATPETGAPASPGSAGASDVALPASSQTVRVQVCYATPELEFLRSLEVGVGTTVEQAIRASGLLHAVPGIDVGTVPVGIYGKKKTLDTVLRERDRVEVYRPLLCDPKETRRRRAGNKPRRDVQS